MNTKKLLIVGLLVASQALVFANEIDIDAQIQEVQNAPQEQRYEMMNQLKAQIATMNEEDRSIAIGKIQDMREEMHAQDGDHEAKRYMHQNRNGVNLEDKMEHTRENMMNEEHQRMRHENSVNQDEREDMQGGKGHRQGRMH